MIKEKYEKPFMEVVELKDDVILSSSGVMPPDCPNDNCMSDISCPKYDPYCSAFMCKEYYKP